MSSHPISSPIQAVMENLRLLRELHQATGCLCEVRKPDNQLVFLGRVQNFDGRAVIVVPVSAREVPPVIYKDEYKLIFRVHQHPPLTWRCVVSGSSQRFWRLDCLNPCHREEHRSNFRQPVQLWARVLCVNSLFPGKSLRGMEDRAKPCKVLDVSLGGLRLRGEELFEPGDYLLVMDLFLDSSAPRPFVFTVQVLWSESLGRQDTRCGCSFLPMSTAEEDRLCAAIFNLQRQDIASH